MNKLVMDTNNWIVPCPYCKATVGQWCETAQKNACNTHKARITAVLALVPAIAAPVRELKERFTLAGEPLPISMCMKMLKLEIIPEGDSHLCYWPLEGDIQYVAAYSKKNGWEEASFQAEDETLNTVPMTEASLLKKLILYGYSLRVKKQPVANEVLASLSYRLLPQVTAAELDTFRSQIKALCAPRA